MKTTEGAFSINRRGGMLVIEVEGIYTAETHALLRKQIRVELIRRDAVKVLVDLRQALVLIDEDQFQAMRDETLAAGPLSAPLGILTSAVNFSAVFQYGLEMTQRGRTTYVFARLETARAWVGEDVLEPRREFEPVSRLGNLA